MVNIVADGAKGDKGGDGFNFGTPAGTGIGGNNANCNFWDDDCAQVGGPGGPGLQGGEGGTGGPGGHGGTIDVELNSFSTVISFSAKGGIAGDGGPGGKGQDGDKGGKGGNGEDCEFGRHGGTGGPGGNSGIGGQGGPGGNGGSITVRAKNITFGPQPQIDYSAGAGGKAGLAGAPGGSGPPGDDGSTTGSFSSSSDCEDMGAVPQWGPVGVIPFPATRGNGASGQIGQGGVLQIS